MADRNELQIGNTTISSDGRSLTFQNTDNANFNVTFTVPHLSDIIAFLRSVKPDETEQRMGFRVPLSISSGLSASITFGDKTCSVRPLNLSLSGILLEFSEGEVFEMPIDTQISIRLQLQDTTAALGGVVRRRIGNQYGISFPDSRRDYKLDPLASLQVIYAKLEKQWLRARIKV
jgi:hypothetical protein